jgi:hypothetical protein
MPTAAIIYLMPHNDLFIFIGYAMFVYGWWVIAQGAGANRGSVVCAVKFALGVLAVLVGAGVAQFFREFTADMFTAISIGMGLLVFVVVAARWLRQAEGFSVVALPVVSVLLCILLIGGVHERADFDLATRPAPPATPYQAVSMTSFADGMSDSRSRKVEEFQWKKTAWLPRFVDERFEQLAIARYRVITLEGHARSAIDHDVVYSSATDVLAYVPRAMQLSMLSPFPSIWLPDNRAPLSRNVQRVLAGVEMLIVYSALPGLIYAIWTLRRYLALWCLIIPATGWLLVYGLAVPVVGSLVRFRFPAFAVLSAIALIGVALMLRNHFNFKQLGAHSE